MKHKGITKRGNSWRIKYDISPDPSTGQRRTKYTTFKGTMRAAEKERARLVTEAEDGVNAAPASLTVGDFLDRWLNDTIKPSVRASTFQGYEIIARKHVIPALGRIALKGITPMHIQAYYSEKTKAGLSPQTIVHHHRLLFQAMKSARDGRIIPFNPCEAVRPPKTKKADIVALGKEELQTLLHGLAGSRVHTLAFLASCTGMRRSELLGLQWGDIDIDQRQLTVVRTMEETSEHGLRLEATKTNSSRRRITLPRAALPVLEQWRRKQDEEHLRMGIGRDETGERLVFTREDAAPVSPRSVSHAFTRAVAKIDVPPVTLHGLRHTHITHLLRDNVNIKVVSSRAGHASVSTTLDTYGHLVDNIESLAADVVDTWFAEAGD